VKNRDSWKEAKGHLRDRNCRKGCVNFSRLEFETRKGKGGIGCMDEFCSRMLSIPDTLVRRLGATFMRHDDAARNQEKQTLQRN
jgi:hypothetical protein